MCVIAIAKKRRLSKKEFRNCFESNSDGFGVGWIDSDKNHNFIKGIMNLDEAWKTYISKVSDGTITLPHVCHFRIGTSGGNVPNLTHPFLIDRNSFPKLNYTGKTDVLFHNGVVSDWYKIRNGIEKALGKKILGDVSDTRVVSIALSLKGKEYLKEIRGGKYVVFENGKIYRYGDFTDINGVLYSNNSYKEYKYVKWSTGKGWSHWNDHYYKSGTSSYYGNSSYNNRGTTHLSYSGIKHEFQDSTDYLKNYSNTRLDHISCLEEFPASDIGLEDLYWVTEELRELLEERNLIERDLEISTTMYDYYTQLEKDNECGNRGFYQQEKMHYGARIDAKAEELLEFNKSIDLHIDIIKSLNKKQRGK